jgi:nucleoside-diphosphate-sugar epimerase
MIGSLQGEARMQLTGHILIAGASGVIGSGAVEHFARTPGWQVTALSRRAPVAAADGTFSHLAADLTDPEACRQSVAQLPPVSHLIYAAVAEAPGLVGGWRDPALMALNGAMFANLLDPLAASGALRHVSLVQGAKAYGAHHHLVEVPCREDQPRDDHANFYWLHEDHLRQRADEAGFAFTIFRPQVLLGAAPGAAMNPVAPIGAYAALCRELGRPFAFPGHPGALWEVVDTGLMAEAFLWAALAPAAAGETFNVTNGDVFVPAHAWPHIADSYGLETGGDAPASLASFFAEPQVQAAWSRLASRHNLRHATLPDLLGQSHHYVDLLLGDRLAAKSVPLLLSTIKLRQAGFAPCRDSLASMLHWLKRMVELRLLPPVVQH